MYFVENEQKRILVTLFDVEIALKYVSEILNKVLLKNILSRKTHTNIVSQRRNQSILT